MTKIVEDVRTGFVDQIKRIIEEARLNALKSVDFHRVLMYWNIGRSIIEEEQQGKDRAEYGKYLIKNLSKKLEPEYGTGFSSRQLYLSCQLFRRFPIVNAMRSQLNWTQYRLLIRMEAA